jgi:hypothetical protein
VWHAWQMQRSSPNQSLLVSRTRFALLCCHARGDPTPEQVTRFDLEKSKTNGVE